MVLVSQGIDNLGAADRQQCRQAAGAVRSKRLDRLRDDLGGNHQFNLRRQLEYSKASANGQLFPFHSHRTTMLYSSTSMNAVFPICVTVPVVVAPPKAHLFSFGN